MISRIEAQDCEAEDDAEDEAEAELKLLMWLSFPAWPQELTAHGPVPPTPSHPLSNW